MNVRGLAALSKNAPLTPYSFTRRELLPNDVAIAIKYAGICHSDIHQVKEEWGGALFPMVPVMARSAARESMIIEINDPLTPAKTINLIFPAQKFPKNA
jgi:hypothetical protein